MKKIYEAPSAELTSFDTEEILGISYTGNGSVLTEKTAADQAAAGSFGAVDLF